MTHKCLQSFIYTANEQDQLLQLCTASIVWSDAVARPARFVVVVLLFYVLGKHLRSCRDGQLT